MTGLKIDLFDKTAFFYKSQMDNYDYAKNQQDVVDPETTFRF